MLNTEERDDEFNFSSTPNKRFSFNLFSVIYDKCISVMYLDEDGELLDSEENTLTFYLGIGSVQYDDDDEYLESGLLVLNYSGVLGIDFDCLYFTLLSRFVSRLWIQYQIWGLRRMLKKAGHNQNARVEND